MTEKSESDPKDFLVGIGVRIVPAGVEGTFVRASLILSPIATAEAIGACGKPVDIRHWPKQVEALLENANQTFGDIKVYVSPVKRDAVPKPDPAPIAVDALRTMFTHRGDQAQNYADWHKRRTADVDAIDKMWGELVAPAGDGDWSAIIAALKGAGARARFESQKLMKPAGPAVPDVRSIGRGQAALLLELERGRSLLSRLKLHAERDACLSRNDECDLGAPLFAARSYLTAAERAGLQGEELKKREEQARTAYEAKSPEEKRAADKLLDDAQQAERRKLAEQRQKAVEAAYKAVRAATGRAERRDAILSLLKCAANDPASACFIAAAAPSAEELAKAVDGSVDRHRDAVHEPDVIGERNGSDPQHDYDRNRIARAAQTRLAGLQSQPSLARLFNLVVDIFVPLDKFAHVVGAADAFAERRGVAGKSRFAFLSASLESCRSSRQVWTVCKVRLAEDVPSATADVWPCTQTEADLFALLSQAGEDIKSRDKLIAEGALSQIDGVVHIAAARTNGGVIEPRFDIISLDAAQSVENRETSRSVPRSGGRPLVTMRTAGLALVDRWRETSALVQTLRSLDRDNPGNAQVIDVEDLTVGYRMDVAVEDKHKVLAWRSLCDRWIRFGDGDELEAMLGRTIPVAADRRAFDAAVVVTAAKIQSAGVGAVAHLDDTVGHWMGPPLGVDANSPDIDLSRLDNSLSLQLSATYSLGPDAAHPATIPSDIRIPRQLFGGGYFFGLTPRLQGGVIRPFRSGQCYKSLEMPDGKLADSERHFAVLPSPRLGPRRLLRHERIEAPIVATPHRFLDRLFDGVEDGIRETADTIVVRSGPAPTKGSYLPLDEDGDKRAVGNSWRVVFPPAVPAEFADRHNQFDSKVALSSDYKDSAGNPWTGPVGGLADVDYDEPSGGFPIYGYSKSSRGGPERATDPYSKPSGDAVFRRRSSTTRREPYYPDPAAHYLVVALRDLAGRMLGDAPLIVPMRPSGRKYPDVQPVVIDVVALDKRSGTPASHGRVLGLQAGGRNNFLRGSDVLGNELRVQPDLVQVAVPDAAGASGTVGAFRVQVALEPGESFEIDLWCLPASSKQLAGWFNAVEAAALVASVDDRSGETCKTCADFVTRLGKLSLPQLGDHMRKLTASRVSVESAMATACGTSLPRGALLCTAEETYKLLCSRPTPELAARTTLTATHAVAQPVAAPRLSVALSRGEAKAVPEGEEPPRQTVIIGGTVTVDRPSTGLIEILAQGASLVSNAFDDPVRRHRTPDEVARGIWPRSPVTGERMKIQDVYGFSVGVGDRVTLVDEEATLLRIDEDIAQPGSPVEATRALEQLQKEAMSAGKAANAVRVNSPFSISDSRARILKVRAVAGSRSAGFFRDGKGDIRPDALACTECAPEKVVVQATKAPAKVAPLTVLPAFKFEPLPKQPLTLTRKVRLRVRMQRPWFSSGEGERLGIVLWPPDILRNRVASDGASAVRDYDVGRGEKSNIAMAEFRDEDLGAGGAYVTRWGLDPIKGGGKLGWLTPPAAFPDLAIATVDGGTGTAILGDEPVYVPRATIPIPVDDGGTRQVRLEAALLTYVPRFDVDHESWYCDIEILSDQAPEPFMRLGLVRYQPYAPAHLRVSEPVAEWLQIPQERTVVVAIEEERRIAVTVAGTGSLYSATAPTGYDPLRIESWTQRPVMKISVLRKGDNGLDEIAELDPASVRPGFSRRAEQAWVPKTQREWEDACLVQVQPAEANRDREHLAVRAESPAKGGRLSWTAKFQLSEDPTRPKRNRIYSVLVEEVQPMLPATYDDEPIVDPNEPANDREALSVTGPRFAALIPIDHRPAQTSARAPTLRSPRKPRPSAGRRATASDPAQSSKN